MHSHTYTCTHAYIHMYTYTGFEIYVVVSNFVERHSVPALYSPDITHALYNIT